MSSSDEDTLFGCFIGIIVLALIAIPLTLCITSCNSTPNKPVTSEVTGVEKIQGKWQVLQVVGPDGKAFEAHNLVMDIRDNIAFQGNTQLRLEFNADKTALKLFAKTDTGEKQVGEVSVTITNDEPIQMLWADKNNDKQETLFEKIPDITVTTTPAAPTTP